MDRNESIDEGQSAQHKEDAEPIPMEQSDLVQKLKEDTSGRPLGEKADAGASELAREVSGTYEARQERSAPEKVAEDLEETR
jgi:hypothetical protein